MKPPLQVPVLFGHWLVQGDKLECRLPRKTVTVRAPRGLLTEVMRLCDGSRAWTEVLSGLGGHWSIETVAAFLLSLVDEQVLVEASEVWAHWSDVAQLPQPAPIGTTADEIATLHHQAQARLLPDEGAWHEDLRTGRNPLAAMLLQRESCRTFDDHPISLETLCSILWATHGVTRSSGSTRSNWHRTVASGGNMHSARWFVAVLRDLPSQDGGLTAAGLYEARFHVSGGASLEQIGYDPYLAWRCLSDPRVLRYASALLLPVYDAAVPGRKYGNRATLFAAIEAGQCLQNAQLMAVSLGAAAIVRGDTIASEVLTLARLNPAGAARWLSMPGMVLGARPSELQREQQQADLRFKVAPNLQPAGTGMSGTFAFAASPALPDGPRLAGSGRAEDPRLAMTKAEAEAWERLAWATPAGLFEACWSDLDQPVAPQELIAYAQHQYASKDLSYEPFSPRRAYLWKTVVDIESGHAHAILGECVHAHHALPSRFRKRAYTSASTSGVAAGTSVEDALMRATLELIERDVFACTWLSGAAPARVDPHSLPRTLVHRLERLADTGMDVVALDLGNEWCPVIALFGQATGLPFTAITAAAAFDAEQALFKALQELEGRFAHALAFPPASGDSSDPMRMIERFYRHRSTFRRSDFFTQASATISVARIGQQCPRNWPELKQRILADGFRLLAADITPDGAAVDQGRRAIHVVRAFVPGLVPIWFQPSTQPAGMPRFMRSAATHGKRPPSLFVHPFT